MHAPRVILAIVLLMLLMSVPLPASASSIMYSKGSTDATAKTTASPPILAAPANLSAPMKAAGTVASLTDLESAWEAPLGDRSLTEAAERRESGEGSWSRMPSTGWTRMGELLNPPGREGRFILWLRARIPADARDTDRILVRGTQLFEVYLDGKRIFSHGSLPPDGKPVYIGTPPRLITLPPAAAGKEVYIRIYSRDKDIGLLQAPAVASEPEILLHYIRNHSVRFILGCFYMLVGLLALYPFFRLKQVHLLSFASFTFFFGLYSTTRTTLVYMFYDNAEFWMVVELATLMIALASGIAFTEHLFGAGPGLLLKRLWQVHLAFAALSLPHVMLHLFQADDILRLYQILILLSMGAVIFRIASVAHKGDIDAKVMLFGMAVLCLGGAADIMKQILAQDSTFPELAYYGAFVFLVCLIIVIIRRLLLVFARLSNSEKLSVAGQLAAGIAHEIRNPVTVISGYLQLMKKSESDSKIIGIMQGEVDRIQLIMNEFLFLAKPSEPKFDSHRIEDIVRDVLQLFRLQALSAGVNIQFRCTKGLPEVPCDNNQLKQVLVNLVKNAMEAMPDGGELSILVSSYNDMVSIAVADTGCGMSESDLARIGEPFYTTKENGNGLGVMICRSIVENHRGSFDIASIAGAGTTVTIKLPVRRK